MLDCRLALADQNLPGKISYSIFNIMLVEKINFSFAVLNFIKWRTLILWMDMDGKTALSPHGISKNLLPLTQVTP